MFWFLGKPCVQVRLFWGYSICTNCFVFLFLFMRVFIGNTMCSLVWHPIYKHLGPYGVPLAGIFFTHEQWTPKENSPSNIDPQRNS